MSHLWSREEEQQIEAKEQNIMTNIRMIYNEVSGRRFDSILPRFPFSTWIKASEITSAWRWITETRLRVQNPHPINTTSSSTSPLYFTSFHSRESVDTELTLSLHIIANHHNSVVTHAAALSLNTIRQICGTHERKLFGKTTHTCRVF